jgi:aspartate/methionine/tyrosine aminotransferase
MRVESPYVRWSKAQPPAAFDLSTSSVLPCTFDDLPLSRDTLSLTGRNEDGFPPLLEAIADRYGVSVDRVATATGSSGANFFTCAALLQPGDEVLVERPGYDPLLAVPALLHARIARFDRVSGDGFAIDPDRVRRALTPRTRLIALTVPHNPTGATASHDALEAIGRIAESAGAHVLVDEVYLDAWATALPPAATRGNVFISSSSLTKSYGLGSLRCGWSLSSPAIAGRIRRVRDVVDNNGPVLTERVAAAAFGHLDALGARARRLLDGNHRAFRDVLAAMPELELAVPVAGTVVFPRLRGVADCSRFCERLRAERDTAVVPGRFFEAPAHFRLGLGGDPQATRLGLLAIAGAIGDRAW